MVSSSNVNTSPVTGRDFRDVDTITKLSTRVATQETGTPRIGVEVRVEVRVHSVHTGYLPLVSHGFGIGIPLDDAPTEVLESTITVVATTGSIRPRRSSSIKIPSVRTSLPIVVAPGIVYKNVGYFVWYTDIKYFIGCGFKVQCDRYG
jgi:hypothetical protein